MLLLFACTAPPTAPGAIDADAPDVERLGEVPAAEDPSDAVFDPDTVQDVTLTMSATAWADISGNPWAENWFEADLSWAGEPVARVGVRAFGYSSHVPGKPPLKLDFDRYAPGRDFRGLEQVKLRNGYLDPSFLHDALGPWLLRRAGVPASRTGWARVTVNGAPVGLYTVMEPIDDAFLRRTYGNDDGPLYSIDGIRGHGLMRTDAPLDYFQYNTSVTGDGADLADLTRIVDEGTDAALDAIVDLDVFFVESIVRTLSGSQDSFSADGNNFYLYNDPDADADPADLHGTWRVIPWDYNFDFATFGVLKALTVDPWRPWETSDYAFDPYTGEPYVDALMVRQIAAGRDVDARARELLAGPLAHAELDARITSWEALLADDVAVDLLGGAAAHAKAVADDRFYLHTRWSDVLGEEVARCAELEAGAVPVRELSPTGSVGWSRLTTDGWSWDGQGVACQDGGCRGFDVRGEHFCTGLFAHAPSDVTVSVPAEGRRLRGAVGLQVFGVDCSGGARFRVEQGGVVLWESATLTSYSEAEALEVSVAPGPLTLVTDPLGDNGCDMTAWLDLRVVP